MEDSGKILYWILAIYLLISQIFTFYFWWEFAGDHSFWQTVFLGFFVAEFKGLLWIFFCW